MRRRALMACVCFGFCCVSTLALGQETQPVAADLQAQNQELRQENQQMREELRQMQTRMDAFEKALEEKLDKANYQEQARAVLKELMEQQPPPEQWVSTLTSKTKLQIYGFLRGEAIHDTRKTFGGYAGFFVQRDGPTGKDDETNITARNSRLGFNLTMPKYNDIETSGKLEMDFGTAQTTGTSELSPAIRLRHAYLQAKTPAATFLAGQTWDVFAPLFPYTDNVAILWMAGNVGYRRPQFRVEREWEISPGHKWLNQVALARAVGSDLSLGAPVLPPTDGIDDGGAGSLPDLQARTAYSTKLLTEKATTIGLSGVVGRREVEAVGVEDERYTAAGVAVDLTLPLTEKLTFRGEGYAGQGLGGYYGNIGQFFDELQEKPIRGGGGWGELAYELNKEMVVRGGWGVDCVDDSTLSNGSQREFNTVPYVNYSYKITPNLTWTVEYQYLMTRFFGSESRYDDHRVSTSFTLNF